MEQGWGRAATYHCRGEEREHFHAVQVSSACADEVLPGFGREFGFPGFEVGAWPVFGERMVLGQFGGLTNRSPGCLAVALVKVMGKHE